MNKWFRHVWWRLVETVLKMTNFNSLLHEQGLEILSTNYLEPTFASNVLLNSLICCVFVLKCYLVHTQPKIIAHLWQKEIYSEFKSRSFDFQSILQSRVQVLGIQEQCQPS